MEKLRKALEKKVRGSLSDEAERNDNVNVAFSFASSVSTDNRRYSHSMVPGGFEVMSYTTRFTPRTSFTMRFEIVFSTS